MGQHAAVDQAGRGECCVGLVTPPQLSFSAPALACSHRNGFQALDPKADLAPLTPLKTVSPQEADLAVEAVRVGRHKGPGHERCKALGAARQPQL